MEQVTVDSCGHVFADTSSSFSVITYYLRHRHTRQQATEATGQGQMARGVRNENQTNIANAQSACILHHGCGGLC
jgi:hypothetical protein